MSVPKSHLPGVLHFAPCKGEESYGLLPLDSGEAGSFSLLKLGAVGFRTQGPLSTTPRGGKGSREHLASSRSLASEPWPCGLQATWAMLAEGCAHCPSSHFSFPEGGAWYVSPSLPQRAA